MKSKIIKLSDITKNSKTSLSAKDYTRVEDTKEDVKEEVKEPVKIVDTKNNLLTFLKDEADKIQDECTDHIVNNVNSDNMVFLDNKLRFLMENDKVTSLGMTQHSFSQLCTKLGIPVRYMEKCFKTGRGELANDNINSFLEDTGKDFMIRQYQDKVRGVLSSSYSKFDTPSTIEVLQESIGDLGLVNKGYVLNSERFHTRLVYKEPLDVEGNEVLYPGIQIDSSDVGRNALTVKYFIYRQVCTNGMVVAELGGVLYHQKHIGISEGDFRDRIVASLDRIPELTAKYQTIINLSQGIKLKELIGVDLKNINLNEEVLDEVCVTLKKKFGIPESDSAKIIPIFRDTYESTQWGFANAVTEYARDLTLERRLEVERLAGSILMA